MTRQLYRWVVTINDPQLEDFDFTDQLTPVSIMDFFESDVGCGNWAFQLEKGEQAGRLHYQCAINTKKKRSKTGLLKEFGAFYDRLLGNEAFQKALESNTTLQDMKDNSAFDYSTKTKTRVRGPWTRNLYYYDGSDLPLEEDLHDWQQFVLLSLENCRSAGRVVNWVYDKVGGAGKSTIMKYLDWKHPRDVTRIPFGNATQMRTVVIKRGVRKLYVFDIPRTRGVYDEMADVYAVIEEVKNGNVQSSMYGDPDLKLLMYPPVVWVFSNSLPKFKALSRDRWRIFTINEKKGIDMVDPQKWLELD